jgi:hypothetical protein
MSVFYLVAKATNQRRPSMRKITFISLFLILLLNFACDEGVNQTSPPKKPKPAVVFPTDDKIPEDLIIRLQRTVCYGTCPSYLLTVKADGKVSFFGQDKTKTKGQAGGEISEENIKKLIAEFKQADFFSLDDSYTSKNCATDNPTVRTTLFINGKVKKIEHDMGCEAPKELTALEDKIDKIVGTEKWIGEQK